VLPAPGPVLDPNQAGNIDLGAGEPLDLGARTGPGTVLDPNQAGNIDLRLQQSNRFDAGKGAEDELPIIRLSGFFQLDDGLFSQPQASEQRIGNALDGVSFRRARLQAFGKLTDFTNYSIMFDFAQAGRPSFMDVWGEQEQIPFFGTIRIGQFRQPGTMESWTSIRHFQFLERSVAFQAVEPFRRVGIIDLPPLNVATSRERISGGCKPREVERWHEGRSSRRSRSSGSSARPRLG
jgi:hypothetical protein